MTYAEVLKSVPPRTTVPIVKFASGDACTGGTISKIVGPSTVDNKTLPSLEVKKEIVHDAQNIVAKKNDDKALNSVNPVPSSVALKSPDVVRRRSSRTSKKSSSTNKTSPITNPYAKTTTSKNNKKEVSTKSSCTQSKKGQLIRIQFVPKASY